MYKSNNKLTIIKQNLYYIILTKTTNYLYAIYSNHVTMLLLLLFN